MGVEQSLRIESFVLLEMVEDMFRRASSLLQHFHELNEEDAHGVNAVPKKLSVLY